MSGITDTVIPSQIDATATDNESISVTTGNKLQIKPSYERDQIIIPLSELMVQQLVILADATITPFDHDSAIVDVFTDSTGYLDTVDASTTASYNATTDTYGAGGVGQLLLGESSWNTGAGSDTYSGGMKITTNNACNLISVRKETGCTATDCDLRSSDKTVLASATFSGTTATFATPYALSASTTYYITADSNGAGYVVKSSPSGTSLPTSDTNVNITGGVHNSGSWNDTATPYNLDALTTSLSAELVVEINLPTITGTVTATSLVCADGSRENGDSITYAIVDGSANSDANLAVNTKNDIVSLTGNPETMTITLTPTATSPTAGYPSIKGYALKLWKA